MDWLSLQFLKISLQTGKLQGRWEKKPPNGDRFASDCILSHAVGLRAPTWPQRMAIIEDDLAVEGCLEDGARTMETISGRL
jgi:hypothetical protein